jgi:hypothetical protein
MNSRSLVFTAAAAASLWAQSAPELAVDASASRHGDNGLGTIIVILGPAGPLLLPRGLSRKAAHAGRAPAASEAPGAASLLWALATAAAMEEDACAARWSMFHFSSLFQQCFNGATAQPKYGIAMGVYLQRSGAPSKRVIPNQGGKSCLLFLGRSPAT